MGKPDRSNDTARDSLAVAGRKIYIEGGAWQDVEGWLYPNAIELIDFIDRCQDKMDVRGHLGEIGLYHGKLFIFLYLLARGGENVVGVDLFTQDNREPFDANLGRYTYPGKDPVIVESDSVELGADDFIELAGGRYRMLSVDGGHLVDEVLHDLCVANAVLADGGVVLLDDYFDPRWHGVSEAVNRFFMAGDDVRIAPFLYAGNKTFFATTPHHRAYRDSVLGAIDSSTDEIRTTEFYGEELVVVT